jgi:acetyl esterase/lipase
MKKSEGIRMKKASINIIVLTLFLCLICCSQEKEAVITGIVKNPNAAHIKINEETIDLDETGQFRYANLLEKSTYIMLDFGEQVYLYVYPGDKVNLDIDTRKTLNSIKVDGDRQAINAYLIQQASESKKVSEYFNKNFSAIVRMDEMDFVAKLDAMWESFYERLESLAEVQKLKDDYFVKTQRSSLLYSWANTLIRYPDWHRQIKGDTTYKPSDSFYDFVDRLDLNDPELLEDEEYKDFLVNYLNVRTDETLNTSSAFNDVNYKRFRAQMATALELFSDPAVRDEMLYSFMYSFVKDYYHKSIDDLIQTFKENCTNSGYIEEIDKLCLQDQKVRDACTIRVYKTIGGVDLDVFIYMPSDVKKGDRKPAVAFFHGGGWECGKPEWGHLQCDHFSSSGLVGFSFEYRLSTQHDTTPIEALKDTKSAIRWIREHAEEFHVDPDKIIGSGYSAGGHLVMCTAMVEGYDESSDDLSINPSVTAMMLWVTPAIVYPGWFTGLLRGRAELSEFNPVELIKPGLPPAIFFQGTEDDTVPCNSVVEYVSKSKAAGNRNDLEVYEGQTHLNWGENAKDVLKKMDKFLVSIGYLKNQ